jgi:predicted nuclease of restriction endonuclease-like (RecB) superfamily
MALGMRNHGLPLKRFGNRDSAIALQANGSQSLHGWRRRFGRICGGWGMSSKAILPSDYSEVLERIKTTVETAQIRTAVTINRELVMLYWSIGQEILHRQDSQGWGAKVINRLSQDLRGAFPQMKGFSVRNLKYMQKFAQTYSEAAKVQQLAAQIPWFHNCVLLDKVKDDSERDWYLQKTLENGWSRSVLVLQIETQLYQRQGKAISNFTSTLPAPQSDLARETFKDPYVFDFLNIGEEAHERAVEKELVKHITHFLLELGAGFAFVGNQYPLNVADKDYFLDLLFYHLKFRCFVVIDLKARGFTPEDAGKMNFYRKFPPWGELPVES